MEDKFNYDNLNDDQKLAWLRWQADMMESPLRRYIVRKLKVS